MKTADGRMIPVSELVRRETGRGPTEIRHIEVQRVTYITANLESGVALDEAVERVRASLSDLEGARGILDHLQRGLSRADGVTP